MGSTRNGPHTTLLLGEKSRGDAQQLAFAIAADLLANDYKLTPASEQADLYESALGAFFAAQEASGKWPQSAPLFHYPNAGNAYCYTYETLSELLRPALPLEEGKLSEDCSSPISIASLLLGITRSILAFLWTGAAATHSGWNSNHHVSRRDPEAWATAEVFAFGQLLRVCPATSWRKRPAPNWESAAPNTRRALWQKRNSVNVGAPTPKTPGVSAEPSQRCSFIRSN